MKILIEPTQDFFVTDEGFPVRLWTGTTGMGIPVTVYIAAICTDPASQETLESAPLLMKLQRAPS
jgi:ribosomal protein S12 methylthiotransferase accessory factor YcaO